MATGLYKDTVTLVVQTDHLTSIVCQTQGSLVWKVKSLRASQEMVWLLPPGRRGELRLVHSVEPEN